MNLFSSFIAALPACLALLCCLESSGAASFSVTPTTVSNTYSGAITLQVTGLGSGETVVVQKFLDVNTNGVIDAGDLPVQQFTLTDGQAGMVIGGVTNFSIPGDTNPVAGQITAALPFNNGDFFQTVVGNYLVKLSSPVGNFTPITNLFTVTNFPFGQKFTGSVVSNGTSTPLPNALVLLFPPPRPGHGLGRVLAATLADSSGGYTVQVPAGSYALFAGKSNFLAGTSVLPVIALGAGATVTTNLMLSGATGGITGKLADAANPGMGIPGVALSASGGNGLLGIAFTDTNGNFTFGVQSGQWSIGAISESLLVTGYVDPNNKTNANAGSSGVIIGYPKASGLVYGSVLDTLGNPLAGVDVGVSDNNLGYDLDVFTDANGKYASGVVAGLGASDLWNASIGHDQSPTNYMYSESAFNQNNGTNILLNHAILANFTALAAPNLITGNVKANGTNIVGVGVSLYASTNIDGLYFSSYMDTDADGNYVFNAGNGGWVLSVNCSGGSDSLAAILGGGGYVCPNNQNVITSQSNAVANFIVPTCNAVQIVTTNLPAGQVNVYYQQSLQAASCSGNVTWSLNDPQDFPTSLTFGATGLIYGLPGTAGTFNFSVHANDGNGHNADQSLALVINSGEPDVMTYYVRKQQDFFQTNATTLIPDTSYGPFNALLGIVQSGLGLVSVANVTLPTSVVKGFPSGNTAIELQVRETFANQAAIDAAYPSGSYSFAISAVDDGTHFPVLNLPSTVYPNAPRVSNYAAAQTINPNLPFLLQWDAFAGGTLNDLIWFFIMDSQGTMVFSTPPPAIDPVGSLKGTATSAPVPPGALQTGTNYLGVVIFFKTTSLNTTGYPGVLGGTFAESRNTFALSTLPAVPTLGQSGRTSVSQFGLNLSGLQGSTYVVISSTNLSAPLSNWFIVQITNLTSSSVFIQDNQATNQQRFYRALLLP